MIAQSRHLCLESGHPVRLETVSVDCIVSKKWCTVLRIVNVPGQLVHHIRLAADD